MSIFKLVRSELVRRVKNGIDEAMKRAPDRWREVKAEKEAAK